MTREQFLNGTPFKVKGDTDYKGASTFKFTGECLLRQARSSTDERVMLESHHLNLRQVGEKGFEGFVYVMHKQVKIKLRYNQLEEFIERA